jgi:hypothetical protein
MRQIIRSRSQVRELTSPPRRIFRGKLAEDYDGIGQYVSVALAGSSVGSAYKARLASGDFGTGQTVPRGTPVSIFSNRGQLEILSLGAK